MTQRKRHGILMDWLETREQESMSDAGIAYACEQDDSVELMMRLLNEKATQQGDCLIWNKSIDKGYGRHSIRIDLEMKVSVRVQAHRLVYALSNGFEALPPSKRQQGQPADHLVLDHLCGNRACVQPAHFQVITISENAALQGQERIAPPLSFGRVIATSGELVA